MVLTLILGHTCKSMVSQKRIESIDLARGIASLIMIQGHAYDGWVAVEYKDSFGYWVTRLFGTLPLPAFMVLSGAAIALRLRSARNHQEPIHDVRLRLAMRGVTVLVWGYLTSIIYAMLDGGKGLDVLLRADVLHAIGLSITLISLWCLSTFGINRHRSSQNTLLDPDILARKASFLAFAVTIICPFISNLTKDITGPIAYPLALLSDVTGITLMPVIPLLSWTAVGLACLTHLMPTDSAPESQGFFFRLALLGIIVATLGHWGTDMLLKIYGGTLSRSHIAVIPNVIDGAGRGVFVLGAGALIGMGMPKNIRRHLVLLGRSSLIAYIFHIPFCYGSLAGPLRGSLDMFTASLFLLLLMVSSYTAVRVFERIKTGFTRNGKLLEKSFLPGKFFKAPSGLKRK